MSRRKPKGEDTPYDSLSGHGGEKLAAAVYYYTNISTAEEFDAWWQARRRSEAKPLSKFPDIQAMADFYAAIRSEPYHTQVAAIVWLKQRVDADEKAKRATPEAGGLDA